MDERRKSKRIELDAKLYVNRLDQQEAKEISIDVYDISTHGIGFNCADALTIGAVYDADLTLWNKDVIHTIIGIFIGMPEMDLKRIEIYDTIETYSKD